ncbi:hypothetical protein C8J57DRAFT_1195528 [Mycena rebaudengoi]|nr:hypothetical protein C8J57DRAFT_1195528 [Mycena rebaudengoi]
MPSDIRDRLLEPDDDDVLALERSLSAARLEQEDLQTPLDVSKYPILTLPTEITTEIFLHFIPAYPECSPISGPLSPTSLGHICQTWRDIAFNTPPLWRAIGLCDHDYGREPWAIRLHVLSIWLSRSKSCPLSISLQYQGGEGEEGEDDFNFAPFLDVMIPHSARWEHIDLILPFEVLRMIGSHFPLLRSLTFGPTDSWSRVEPGVISPFSSAPRLMRVDMSYNFDPFTILLPLSQLTSISAPLLRTSHCAEILRQAGSLVEFQADVFIPFVEDDNINALHMKHLQSLKLGHSYIFNPGSGGQLLLGALTAPALRFLKISERLFTNQDPISSVNAFISRSGCALTSLKIIQALTPETTYRAAFPQIDLVTAKHKAPIMDYNSDEDDEEEENDDAN